MSSAQNPSTFLLFLFISTLMVIAITHNEDKGEFVALPPTVYPMVHPIKGLLSAPHGSCWVYVGFYYDAKSEPCTEIVFLDMGTQLEHSLVACARDSDLQKMH